MRDEQRKNMQQQLIADCRRASCIDLEFRSRCPYRSRARLSGLRASMPAANVGAFFHFTKPSTVAATRAGATPVEAPHQHR